MSHATVEELISLFSEGNNNRPVFLLGAGASFASGVPLAHEAVVKIARASYARRKWGVPWRHYDRVMTSDWKPYLETQDWFPTYRDNLSEAFPDAVKNLLVPDDFRREFLLEMTKPTKSVSVGYIALSDLIFRGLCWSVLTTNFDTLISETLRMHQPHLKDVIEVNRVPGDHSLFSVYNRSQVVYLHGAVEYYTDQILKEETTKLNDGLIRSIRVLLRDAPLIVVGYRGAEYSIMNHLLEDSIQECNGFKHGIYWCVLDENTVGQAVRKLSTGIGSNFRFVRIKGFDELLQELNSALVGRGRVDAQQPPHLNKSLSYEEETVLDATIDDLDMELIKSTLIQYRDRLKLTYLKDDSFIPFLTEQGFIRKTDGVDRPIRALFLLFAKEVSKRFQFCKTLVELNGRQRTVVEGNLLQQREKLSYLLTAPEVNPKLRIKKGKDAEEKQAYPDRAITELIVNMLVHRDYSTREYSKVIIEPGIGISFITPGGLPEKVLSKVNPNHKGEFDPVRNLSEMRNRYISDIFYGIGAMDKAGSGLPDVKDLMSAHYGAAAFRVTENNTAVWSILSQATQQTPGEAQVAVPITENEIYTTNLLPIVSLPKEVFILETNDNDTLRAFDAMDAGSSSLPVVIADRWNYRQRIITFVEPQLLANFIPINIKNIFIRSEAVEKFLKDIDQRRRFVWLLGKHFGCYLLAFKNDGLLVDIRGKKAYFSLVNGTENKIVYLSRMNRKTPRTVVKRRETSKHVFHENEGFVYSIEEISEQWAIRIKPIYVFTIKDGITPLPPYRRTRLATSRIKFDRNKNVEDDLFFWSRYLGLAKTTIGIGGSNVPDLIANAFFLEYEVAVSSEANSL